MTTFTQHPAFNYRPSHSDELRWASDRVSRVNIPAYLQTQAFDEAARNKVQVEDSGLTGKHTFYRGHRRRDVNDFWGPHLIQNRSTWRSGLYGDSIFAVNYDRNLAGLDNLDPKYNYPSGKGGGGFGSHVFDPPNAAPWSKFIHENWNFDAVQDMIDKEDPTFKDYSVQGWKDAIDKEFGVQADFAREALEQNGWNPKETGKGAANANAYMYLVKRRLRDIYLQQWAQTRYDHQNFTTGKDSNRFWGDFGKGIVLDIFTDYEILVDIPITMGLGTVGTVFKGGAVALRSAGELKRIASGIRRGKYAAGFWENARIGTAVGVKEGVSVPVQKVIRVFQLTNAKGARAGRVLSEAEVASLKSMGVLKDVSVIRRPTMYGHEFGLFNRAGVSEGIGYGGTTVTETKLIGKSKLAYRLGLSQDNTVTSALATSIETSGQALLSSMGWTSNVTGSALEFLGFMNLGRNIGALGQHAAAAGVWGAATGVGFSLGSQEDKILMADITYGVGNHDVTFSGGKVVHDSLLFGGAGVVLGGMMSGFMGGFFKHYWNGAKQYGWKHRKEFVNDVLGQSRTTRADGTPQGLVAQLNLDIAVKHVADMIDQTAGEIGQGARLLDIKMIEKNWLLADDIAQFLTMLLEQLDGHFIPITALEPIVMDLIKNSGKNRVANMAERIANNKKRAASLWREHKAKVKETPAGKQRIDSDIPTRDYGSANKGSGLTWHQRSQLAELRENVNIVRNKANKEGRAGEISNDTKTAYESAIDALEKWHEANDIPFLPSETIPSVRFKDYDLSATEPGAIVARLIKIQESITAAGQRGALPDEINKLKKQFIDGLDALDAKYPRQDSLSRREVLEDKFNILMTEIRGVGDEVTATAKERLMNLILEKMGAESPAGDRAHSMGWFDDVMNASGLGKGLTALASLGTGYSDMVYSLANEIRMLARMIDSSHEALADDIGLFGRMRSVWSAQRQAFRDGGHVLTAANKIETEVGIVNLEYIQLILNRKRIAGEEITIEDFTHKIIMLDGKEVRVGSTPTSYAEAEKLYKHAINLYEETNRYFKSMLEKGQATQLLKQGLDHERYLPMMFVDTMTDAYVEQVGKEGWRIKAQELLETDTVAWVELEALGLINLRKGEGADTGNIMGIHSIPDDSFLYIPGKTMAEMEKILDNLDRGVLRAWQAVADQNRIKGNMAVHQNHLDSLTSVLEKQRLSTQRLSPEAAEQYYKNTQGRYLNAIGSYKTIGNIEDLALAAKELYTLVRQTSEFKRFNSESALEYRAFAEERLSALEAEYGITIIDPINKPYTTDSKWVVSNPANWHTDLTPGALPKEPVVIAVNHPEILQNGKIIKEADVVVSDIVGVQDIPSIGFLRPLDDDLGVVERGQVVVHSPTSGPPKFTEASEIEDIILKVSKEDIEATRVMRANEIYKEVYLEQVTKGTLTKKEGRSAAIIDANNEVRATFPEEFTHTLVKVKGVDDLIPSHELQTVGKSGTPDSFTSLTEHLRYNSLYGIRDYDMLGAKDLTSLIESLSGTTIKPIDMGVTTEFLKRSGITHSDLVEHLTNNVALREIFEIAATNSIDISKFVLRYLQEVMVNSQHINKRNIVTWLKETNPIPQKEHMLTALGHPHRLKEAVDVSNSNRINIEEILPNIELLIERNVLEIDENGIVVLLKPLEGEDLEVYSASIIKTKTEYDSGLTWTQKELIRRGDWDKLSSDLNNVLVRIHEIKQSFINDNLARISSGEAPVNNRLAMEEAISNEFPGLKLWDPSEDIGDNMFTDLLDSLGKVKTSRWEATISSQHKRGIKEEAQDFIGPRPRDRAEEFITPEEVTSHLVSPESVTKEIEKQAANKSPQKLSQKQKIQKYFPESTPDQLNNKTYRATKMQEIKRIEYLENVDRRIASDLEKVNTALTEIELKIGAIRELPTETMEKHFALVQDELDARVELAKAVERREAGGFDNTVDRLEQNILSLTETMLGLTDVDVRARIRSDRAEFQNKLPKKYKGNNEEQTKYILDTLIAEREEVRLLKKGLRKGKKKNKALGRERGLSAEINKLEDVLEFSAHSVTTFDQLQMEFVQKVTDLETRLLTLQGSRKRVDPAGDELVRHTQKKLDAIIEQQKKLIPIDSLETRMDRLLADRSRLEFIKALRESDYDPMMFVKKSGEPGYKKETKDPVTLMDLLDTPVHWWQQGKLARTAQQEHMEAVAKIRKEALANIRKLLGAGKDVFSEGKPTRKGKGKQPKKNGATVGNYNQALKDFPSRAEELQENLAMIAVNYGIRKGWFGDKAGTSVSIYAQEMLDIIQEMTMLASLNYSKFNVTPAEIIIEHAATLGMGSMTPYNAEYLVKNLFKWERVWDVDKKRFVNKRRGKGKRFKGGEDNTVPIGLLIYHAANELRRRKGLKGHSSEMSQFPRIKKEKSFTDNPYENYIDSASGEWVGAPDRFADPFGYEYGSTFGRPLAALNELANIDEFNTIVRGYFSTDGLSLEDAIVRDRQYALVRLILEEEKGGSRILRRAKWKGAGIEGEIVSPTIKVSKDRLLRTKEFPHRSDIYTKTGSLKLSVVAKMLKERGIDVTVKELKTDVKALKKFYALSLGSLEHLENANRIMSSPESFQRWFQQSLSDAEKKKVIKNASNLVNVEMDGSALLTRRQDFNTRSKKLENDFNKSVLSPEEIEQYKHAVFETNNIYVHDFTAFLDNIIVYAKDPIRYMKEELVKINDRLELPRFKKISDNKWFVKYGWAKPDAPRVPDITVDVGIIKGSKTEFNRLVIEHRIITAKLADIRENIHTTVARDLHELEVPPLAKWLPDIEHSGTMFQLKDIIDGDVIRKKDFLELHNITDDQWKKVVYPQLVKLRKEGFVTTAVVNGQKVKGWQLTQKGRDYVNTNDKIVINVHNPNKDFSTAVNSELLTNPQIKKLLGLAKDSEIKILSRDKSGFTKDMRDSHKRLIKLKRQARDRGDVRSMALYEAQIRALKAKAVPADLEVGFMLLKELRIIYRELRDIRNMKAYGQEAGPKAFEQFKELTRIYKESTKRATSLEYRKHKIIDKLQEIFGKRAYDRSEFRFDHSSIFDTARTKPIPTTKEAVEEIGTTSQMSELLKMFEKEGIDPTTINPNYRGATDAATINEKYVDALSGNTVHYTDRMREKLGDGRTALQDALYAWARRMNGERAGTGSGFDPIAAGSFRSTAGEPHLGDHTRTFSAEILAKHPEFMQFFESDIRKIVANYARTMGSQIRAQEVLNDWMQHLAIGIDKKVLANIRWDDIFDLIEAKVTNMTKIINKNSTQTISKAERDAMVEAVKLAKHAYYDMIGRPYHEGWKWTQDVVKAANNTAQAMFGPGISTAVALVEFPMAIVARSGDLGGLVNGFGVAGRNLKHMNTLERSDLEGTAFVLDNYVHSGLHRYLDSNGDDMESRVSARIRAHWSTMFEGSERTGAMGRAMDNINNFLEGTAKIGSELSGLRQAINMVKAVAVGKAKYVVMKNANRLMDFGELLDPNKLRTLTDKGSRTKYIKGVAREAGVHPTLAFRWFRAGLVGDNDGTVLNVVVKNLLNMGSTMDNQSFDLTKMWKGMNEMEHSVGAGKALYEDVFDRLALFLELHAHDLSPEPRGLVRFGLYNSPLGRLFAFYASYPISFFMTYFKKNPSEMSTLGALATILTLSGFEMFHQQVRALARGEDWDETAEKWKEHPWAMMFRHGSNTPWLGYTNGLIREMLFLPVANRFLGDRNYPVTVGRTAGLAGIETVFSALQDMIAGGNIVTRGANTNTEGMRSIDYLATGGQFAKGEKQAQASKILDVMYDMVLPTKAFYWVLVDKMFDYEFNPQVGDVQDTILRAYTPILQELKESGDIEGYNRMLKEIRKVYFHSSKDPMLNIPVDMPNRETPLFDRRTPKRKQPTAPMPKFYRPSGKPTTPSGKAPVTMGTPQDVVAQLEETPTYSSIPEGLI